MSSVAARQARDTAAGAFTRCQQDGCSLQGEAVKLLPQKVGQGDSIKARVESIRRKAQLLLCCFANSVICF